MSDLVYVVAHENGDDMCGGLNLHGIYTSENAARARLNEVVSEGFADAAVYLVPLDIPGWLGYGSSWYAANEGRQRAQWELELEAAWQFRDRERLRRLQDEAEERELELAWQFRDWETVERLQDKIAGHTPNNNTTND